MLALACVLSGRFIRSATLGPAAGAAPAVTIGPGGDVLAPDPDKVGMLTATDPDTGWRDAHFAIQIYCVVERARTHGILVVDRYGGTHNVLHLLGGRHTQDVNHAPAGDLHFDSVIDSFALDARDNASLDSADHHAGFGVVELGPSLSVRILANSSALIFGTSTSSLCDFPRPRKCRTVRCPRAHAHQLRVRREPHFASLLAAGKDRHDEGLRNVEPCTLFGLHKNSYWQMPTCGVVTVIVTRPFVRSKS